MQALRSATSVTAEWRRTCARPGQQQPRSASSYDDRLPGLAREDPAIDQAGDPAAAVHVMAGAFYLALIRRSLLISRR